MIGFALFCLGISFLMAYVVSKARREQLGAEGNQPMGAEPQYMLTNDGQTIRCNYGGTTEVDLLKKFGKAGQYKDKVDIAVRDVDRQTSILTVKLGKANGTHSEGHIGEAIWSRKHQTLFFVEMGRDFRSARLWSFDIHGFKAVSRPHGFINTLTISQDEDSIVAHANDKLLTFDIEAGTESLQPYPASTSVVMQLTDGSTLLQQYGGERIGKVLWSQNGKEIPLSVDGAIIDATILDGDVWALRQKDSKIEFVQLDSTLKKVAQNLGPIE